MKRIAAALSLRLLANSVHALEIGKPFEQLDIDRALPNIPEREASATVRSRPSARAATPRC